MNFCKFAYVYYVLGDSRFRAL